MIVDMTVQSASSPSPQNRIDGSERALDRLAWAGLAFVLLFVVALRLRLAPVPLERDEGEFAFAGQLLLQGIPPYREAYAMKLPGVYAVYAVFLALFGQTTFAVHLGLLIVNAVATVLLFLIARRLLGRIAAVSAAAVFAVTSASPDVLGMAAHATQYVVAFALGGLYLLMTTLYPAVPPPGQAPDDSFSKAPSRRPLRLLVAGLLLGGAILMKQSGGAFTLLALVLTALAVLRRPVRETPWGSLLRDVLLVGVGAAVPTAATWGLLAAAGVLEKSIFWNVSYAKEYATLVPPDLGWAMFVEWVKNVSRPYLFLYFLALVGLTTPFWSPANRKAGPFVIGLFVFGALAVIPGFYFRPHYFVQALPGVALGMGALVEAIAHIGASRSAAGRPRGVSVVVAALALLAPLGVQIAKNAAYFFQDDPVDACRRVYVMNPFPETVAIADYLRRHTEPGERIAVFGSEPQIFFLSGRRSATGYIYMYSMMEPQKYAARMQDEMIREVEAAHPRYIVLVSHPGSWTEGPYSLPRLRQWIESYRKDFVTVGVADQLNPAPSQYETHYVWDDEAPTYRPQSPFFVAILKRR